MIRAAFVLLTAALAGGCEDAPPSRDAGDAALDLGRDASPDLADGATPDLAPHVVMLPPPSALMVTLEPAIGGGLDVHARFGGGGPIVRLVRRADTLPLGPFDAEATVVSEGVAGEAVHPARSLRALQGYFYAAFSCDGAGGCEGFGVQVPFELTLAQGLLDGGYTIYLRHAIADQCSDALALGDAASTSTPDWWKSCDTSCATATARQLGATGLVQAAAIGQALTTRAIPFDRIRASEFCRARSTAQALAISGVPITTDGPLTYFVYAEALRCAQVGVELALPPAPGKNTLLVGHADFATPCDPLAALAEGEAAVNRPEGTSAHFIQLVSATEWASLP